MALLEWICSISDSRLPVHETPASRSERLPRPQTGLGSSSGCRIWRERSAAAWLPEPHSCCLTLGVGGPSKYVCSVRTPSVVGLAEHVGGLAAEGDGVAAEGDGLAAEGRGFAAEGDGLAAEVRGFAAEARGFAAEAKRLL